MNNGKLNKGLDEKSPEPEKKKDPHIRIKNEQNHFPVDFDWVELISVNSLLAVGIADGELGVSFVGVSKMTKLNRKFMGERGPTDVLSFPIDPPPENVRDKFIPHMWGDVVICPEAVSEDVKNMNKEVVKLLVHGILHIAGYDHDTPKAEAEMFSIQDEICEKFH